MTSVRAVPYTEPLAGTVQVSDSSASAVPHKTRPVSAGQGN